MRDRFLGEDDVVVLRSPYFEESEIGLGEGNAVTTFGVTGDLLSLDRRVSTVVQAVQAVIVYDGAVADESALPGIVETYRDVSGPGRVQLQPDTVELIDENTVDEQLEPGTDVDRRFGRLRGSGR